MCGSSGRSCRREGPVGEDDGVRSRYVRLVVAAAVMVLVTVGCGSGSGTVNPSSSLSRPSQAPTIPDATVRPSATDAPVEATEAPAEPTEAPARTEAPTIEASEIPAPGPETTPAAATSDEGSSPWWPWLLGALAVAAAVVGVIALVRRSPKATPSPAPTAPMAAVLAQSDEISTQLVGLASGSLGSVAGAEASRLAVLITMVEQLMTSAPDETSRRALATLHEPMRSLHGALDAIALSPQPPSAAEVAEIRARATTLHSATSLARASLLPPSPGPPV